ncbi:MAG: glycosyltransferase [Pseudohongiellaceae bacterium]
MTDQTQISLSIAVVCFNSCEQQLQQLLDSTLTAIRALKAQVNLAPVTLYLIDNSDRQHLSLEKLSHLKAACDELQLQLKLLHGHGNVGYGAAHNLVIDKLQSDYHLLMNPDLRLEQNSLAAGIAFLEQNVGVALASPYAEHEDGQKQYLCKRYPSVFTFLLRGFLPGFIKRLFAKGLARFEMHELSESQPTLGIPIASGCFMLCRSAALKQIGGFDERYFLYFEDFDLSLRLTALGQIAYLPSMRITHGGGNAARKGREHIKMFTRSGIRFFNTHGWRWLRQPG